MGMYATKIKKARRAAVNGILSDFLFNRLILMFYLTIKALSDLSLSGT